MALLIGAAGGAGWLLITGCGPVTCGWRDSLAGLTVAAVWWLPGLLLRQLGAGDVKFAACIGLLLGLTATIEAMLIAAATLGVMAVVAAANSKRDARLPAAVALCVGLLVRLGWGPIWMG